MQRCPEPELMNDRQQVLAYAAADFSAGDGRMIQWLQQRLLRRAPLPEAATLIDLGCGPGNISLRLAQHFPGARVIGVDGAQAMVTVARERAAAAGLTVEFHCCDLRQLELDSADLVLSNSLLHHLHDPALLWQATRRLAGPGCRVLHRDLRRPSGPADIDLLQQRHLPDAPPVLLHDFRASLAAAFEVHEVQQQLHQAGLDQLTVQEEDDRYLVVSGLVN